MDTKKQVCLIITSLDHEVEQHAPLCTARRNPDACNNTVERNLVDCLEKLKVLLEKVDADEDSLTDHPHLKLDFSHLLTLSAYQQPVPPYLSS